MHESFLSRRKFLGYSSGLLTILGLQRPLLASPGQVGGGRAKRCVVLWMNGGPSQLETFDPKPHTSTGGPTLQIQTSVPDIHIAEHLPEIASRMDKLILLRNITSSEGEHERAQYYLHTGFQLVPAFPRPALGSVISHEWPVMDFPKYVVLGGRAFGPAYCGVDHSAFVIEDLEASRELLGRVRRRKDDLEFLRSLGRDFDQRNGFSGVARRRAMLTRIETLVGTSFRDALNINAESTATRARYGDHPFGQRCLAARRLLERDVPFVEVQLDGWDTHINNFQEVGRLATSIDAAWSALIDDLSAAGLWDDTLLVWMGEFGRTPLINGQNGRDHFPNVTPVVLGGGCLNSGQVIGKTNRGGQEIDVTPYHVADLSATVLKILGIDPNKKFQTSFDSPTEATDSGILINEVADFS